MARPLPDVVFLLVNSIARAALARSLNLPEVERQWVEAVEAEVKANGKLSKFAAAYVSFHPPPAFWGYYCLKCRWWVDTGNPAVGRCSVVEGDINAGGWCALWTPPPDEPIGSWLTRYPQDLPRLLAGLAEGLRAPLGREKVLPAQHFPEVFGQAAAESFEEPRPAP